MSEQTARGSKRILLVFCAITLLLVLYPVEYRSTRIATLIGLLGSFGAAVYLFWRSKVVRTILLVVGIAPLVVLCLPGRQADVAELRSEYVRFLRSFENSRYIWGGESYLGIDCSGLVRKPLMLANVTQGLRTLNGSQLRAAFLLWWNDASALALRDGYRNQTVKLSTEISINSADHSSLHPGDLAVTADGVHVLAYLGENKWIEADPNLNRVVRLAVPSENPWFNVGVHMMRWQALSN